MMRRLLLAALAASLLFACGQSEQPAPSAVSPELPHYYGTLEPFAEQAIYFVMTDRFVNGDPDNDLRDQGGDYPTFDRPLEPCDGVAANVGYLGGDFRGLLDHADYIQEMGFGAVWITPIAENPSQAFSGGSPPDCESVMTDQGKAGYHGYWAVNFHRTDPHLVSADLDFAGLTAGLREQGLLTVLDIVGNHGSPGWSMQDDQNGGFGQIHGPDGELLADHQNLEPGELNPDEQALHRWFRTEPSLAELASLDPDNPEVVDYLADAYLRWIDQGADAFRVDTIAYMPHEFWREVADRIEQQHPGFFMFGEVFSSDPEEIAPYTLSENGGYSVLDFPQHGPLREVFENPDSDFATLAPALFLDGAPYRNVYELVTFYDNHDMARLNADDAGFINAHNWLFTARGIPVVYYGSEMGFKRGRREHAGNRNYFGVEGINAAREHPIRQQLSRIASVRAASPALQKGLQLMLELEGDRAAFYRVFQTQTEQQIALVLLNKGERPEDFAISEALQAGLWREALSGAELTLGEGDSLETTVPANDVQVWLLDAPVSDPKLIERLEGVMVTVSN